MTIKPYTRSGAQILFRTDRDAVAWQAAEGTMDIFDWEDLDFERFTFDANDGKTIVAPEVPWYLKTLQVSRPLHFGDYGGLPLKIVWALLDVITIIILVSGMYLWVARRRSSVRRKLLDAGQTVAAGV